ncbi:hypothetical protein [Muricauda sp. MAR_2010_75]|uniref:hypothetical protein n=1 Tax=Allomuricauda sp. MAR_2010_75 TaxID=1250232 RepID=UPI00055A588B|nr:hypothetical protein [Muricauda sp. MAR_2010_75]
MSNMKVFEYKFPYLSGAFKEWVLAPNREESDKFYLSFTDCGNLEGAIITEIPIESLSAYFLIDPNEPEPDEDEEDYNEEDYSGGYKKIESFKDFAERETKTQLICCNEF